MAFRRASPDTAFCYDHTPHAAEIRQLAKGRPVALDLALAEELATPYLAHAEYQERFLLPLSAQILSSNEMSAPGLALHLRHQDEDSVGNYI